MVIRVGEKEMILYKNVKKTSLFQVSNISTMAILTHICVLDFLCVLFYDILFHQLSQLSYSNLIQFQLFLLLTKNQYFLLFFYSFKLKLHLDCSYFILPDLFSLFLFNFQLLYLFFKLIYQLIRNCIFTSTIVIILDISIFRFLFLLHIFRIYCQFVLEFSDFLFLQHVSLMTVYLVFSCLKSFLHEFLCLLLYAHDLFMGFLYLFFELLLVFQCFYCFRLTLFYFYQSILLILHLLQNDLNMFQLIFSFLHNLVIKHTVQLSLKLEYLVLHLNNLQLLFLELQFLTLHHLILILRQANRAIFLLLGLVFNKNFIQLDSQLINLSLELDILFDKLLFLVLFWQVFAVNSVIWFLFFLLLLLALVAICLHLVVFLFLLFRDRCVDVQS